MSAIQIITANIVPETQRLSCVDTLFGINYVLKLEPMVFQFAGDLSPTYNGAYWSFYRLNPSGFFMAPRSEEFFAVSAENGFEGHLSAVAFGIMVCMYAFSNLSFAQEDPFSQVCAEQYHLLREYAMQHPEVNEIFAAID